MKVNRINPLDIKTIFDRFMIDFPAVRDGFNKGCKPFIGIDGCHLKEPYKGFLLSTVALNGNIRVYPLVVCICDT